MKVIFLSMALLALLPSVFSQNTLSTKTSAINPLHADRWNLDKYIYSHTHYETGSKDKAVIDFDAIDNWQGVGENVTVSDDGKYFVYKLITGRGVESYNRKKPDSLVIQSTSGSWRFSYAGGKPGIFSSRNDQYIFQNKDTLYFVGLGTKKVRVVDGIGSYKANSNNQWLAYQLKEGESNLVLLNLVTGKERSITKVGSYEFDKSGKWLTCKLNDNDENLLMYNLKTGLESKFSFVKSYSLYQSGDRLLYQALKVTGIDTVSSLQYCNLLNNDTKKIWESNTKNKVWLTNYSLDHSERQLVYVLSNSSSTDSRNPVNYSIWYYQEGINRPVMKVNAQTKGMLQSYILQGDASFTDNDQYIRFSTSKMKEKLQQLTDPVSVDVWSSQDKVLQSEQSYLDKEIITYASVIGVNNDSVISLESDYVKLYDLKGDFALVKKSGRNTYGDRFWEKGYDKDSNILVSLNDGSRRFLPTSRVWSYNLWFSPNDRYLVYCDGEQGCHYFSYDLQTRITKQISIGVPDGLLGSQVPNLISDDKPNFPIGTAGWLDDGRSVLVYDNYDIWRMDLWGEKPAINITNGYGRAHGLYFGLLNSDRYLSSPIIIPGKAPLVLAAFNTETKENGFYQASLNTAADPKSLYMGPYFFWGLNGMLSAITDGMRPVKAKDVNTWIVLRQTATSAPNYFLTKDFRDFKQLTDLRPQKNYNWLSTKLISFKQLDGTQSQGVLYLPENFDSTKKYPVIISFYVSLSNRLYQYPTPCYIDAPHIYDNPSWMVSHGYLVFTPDIHFKEGEWGPSTVSAIDGAARHLKTLPFVDNNHLAATGHSNSGRFGYYLLTHSHSFAAMSIGSGFTGTDVISLALSLDYQYNRTSNLKEAEKDAVGAGGLGILWENKEKWIDHTAVLQADKATSPLLLFHCKKDVDDVRAAVELYTAFRRLEKPIWWLQYDKGSHTVTDLYELRDFSIRFTQFFDHYLKGAPMPLWMKEGIPNKLKGIVSGFDWKIDRD